MENTGQPAPRIAVNLEMTFQYSRTVMKALILNLSTGGIFVKTSYPPPIDAMLALRFHLPGTPEPINIEGRVVWIKKESNAFPSGMGIEFNEIPPEYKERLHAFVQSRIVT